MKLVLLICEVVINIARTIKFAIDSFETEIFDTQEKEIMKKKNNENYLDYNIAKLREEPFFSMFGVSATGEMVMELWLKIRATDRTDELEVIRTGIS